MKHLKKFEESHPGLTDYAYDRFKDEVGSKEEDPFDYEPTDDNPVVQEYYQDLRNIHLEKTDDFYDLKNLQYAVEKFKKFIDEEIKKIKSK